MATTTGLPGDILLLKLVTGEEIICRGAQLRRHNYQVHSAKKLMLGVNPGGGFQISLLPWVLGASNKDCSIVLKEEDVLGDWTEHLSPDLARSYYQSTTGLVLS